MDERVNKSILNAKVNLLFYFLTIFLSFFSRKIFLDCLGTEFIGLTGTLGNILGYLNLAELGIGSCVSFFLYKPLEQKNKEQIIEIMSVFRYLYRIIGLMQAFLSVYLFHGFLKMFPLDQDWFIFLFIHSLDLHSQIILLIIDNSFSLQTKRTTSYHLIYRLLNCLKPFFRYFSRIIIGIYIYGLVLNSYSV